MDAFRVALVTSPGGKEFIHIPEDFDLSGFSRYDEESLKPALLYADHIDLYSYRSTLAQSLTSEVAKLKLPVLGSRQLFAVLNEHTDEQLERLGVIMDLVPDLQYFRQAGPDLVEDVGGPLEFWDRYGQQILEINRAYFTELKKGFDSMQSDPIKKVEELGLVEVHHWNHIPTVPPEPFPDLWTRAKFELAETLSELDRPLMIDPASLAMIGAESERSVETAIESLATMSLSRLPNFEKATIAEILEIRSDLAPLLAPFRAEMIALGREVYNNADADVGRAASYVWHERVAPIVAELDYETQRSRYLRDLLGVVTSGKDALVSAAGVVVAVGAAASGVSVLLPGVAAAAAPLVQALGKSVEARQLARKNRLFFLHAAGKRLRRKSARKVRPNRLQKRR